MTTKTYEEGVTEGKLAYLKSVTETLTIRVNDHSQRLRILERAMWVMLGIVTIIQIWPSIQKFLQG